MLPFNQTKLSNNQVIREFNERTDTSEFVWHRDKEDRLVEPLVEPLHETDWLFQLDNELPIPIKDKIFIPKETYHRIIKGSGDLRLLITFLI